MSNSSKIRTLRLRWPSLKMSCNGNLAALCRSADRDRGRDKSRDNDGHKHHDSDRKRSRSREGGAQADRGEEERVKRQKVAENGVILPKEVTRHFMWQQLFCACK